ncbi:hypothetical protein KCU81_g9281, partial [Aureobasidium melanogenum]|uniref:C2H2-type domain-containing protein n=1 Tax=Aureobasidium melanogenum (strain CBS 110374) TaxID=1043003 RepID=A0A074VGD2_AURM1
MTSEYGFSYAKPDTICRYEGNLTEDPLSRTYAEPAIFLEPSVYVELIEPDRSPYGNYVSGSGEGLQYNEDLQQQFVAGSAHAESWPDPEPGHASSDFQLPKCPHCDRRFRNKAEEKYEGCTCGQDFATSYDLERHQKGLMLGAKLCYWRCALPTCAEREKLWTRKDKFKAHISRMHMGTAMDVEQLVEKVYSSKVTPNSVEWKQLASARTPRRVSLNDRSHSHGQNPVSSNVTSPVRHVPPSSPSDSTNPIYSESIGSYSSGPVALPGLTISTGCSDSSWCSEESLYTANRGPQSEKGLALGCAILTIDENPELDPLNAVFDRMAKANVNPGYPMTVPIPSKHRSSSDQIFSFGPAEPSTYPFCFTHNQLSQLCAKEHHNPADTAELGGHVFQETNPRGLYDWGSLPLPMSLQYHDPTLGPSQPYHSNDLFSIGDGYGLTSDQLQSPGSFQCDEETNHESANSDKEDRTYEQFESHSGSEDSQYPTDTDSMASSGGSADDIDSVLLDLEISKFRAWLVIRCTSDAFFRQLTSTSKRSSGSSPKATPLLPSPSSSQAASSRKPSDHSKSDDCGRSDRDRPNKRRRVTTGDELPQLESWDMYQSILTKSSEHLRRVHGDQPLQCPRCARMGFGSPGELQAHQIAPEPCSPVPLTAVKRIRWMTHDERTALQSAVNQRLRGGTDEEKWRFAYRRLFPETGHTPCPYLQDPVISIISSVVDDFELHLREMIQSSNDLDDLASRIPIIRRLFLARYGIHEVEQDPPSLVTLRTVSSSPSSGRLTTAMPPEVSDPVQPHLEGDANHDRPVLSTDSQQYLNVLSTGINAHQDVPLEPLVTSDIVWLQNDEFSSLDDISSWDPSTWYADYDTTTGINNNLYVTENPKDLHGHGP